MPSLQAAAGRADVGAIEPRTRSMKLPESPPPPIGVKTMSDDGIACFRECLHAIKRLEEVFAKEDGDPNQAMFEAVELSIVAAMVHFESKMADDPNKHEMVRRAIHFLVDRGFQNFEYNQKLARAVGKS
jgi:hypothetical protein